MINNHLLDRPALTAIAAVLAFTSTPLLAQETTTQPSVSPATPVTTDAPTTTAPVALSTMTAPPVTLPPIAPTTANTPETPAPQAATPVLPQIATPSTNPVAADRTVEATPHAAERPAVAERTADRTPARAAPAPEASRSPTITAAPAPQPAMKVTPAQPITTPVTDSVMDDTRPANPAPVTTATDDSGNIALWVLGAGGLIAVAGLGVFAMRSRRRPEVTYAGEVVTEMPEPRVEPEIPVAAATAYAAPIQAPARFAATASPQTATAPVAGQRSALEALIAETPSDANPFLTRRNRMRRAKFLLANGEVSAPMGNRQYPATVAATQAAGNAAVKPGRVYDFGKATNTRWPNWKPATT